MKERNFWSDLVAETLNKKDKKNKLKRDRQRISISIENHGVANLSGRECDCIALAKQGYTMAYTANYLGISDRTVEEYLDSAKIKLKCKNNKELVKLITNSNFSEAYISTRDKRFCDEKIR